MIFINVQVPSNSYLNIITVDLYLIKHLKRIKEIKISQLDLN